jgi:hypothetical protein
MTKKIKEFENWLDEMTSSFSEEPMFNTEEVEETKEYCEQCDEDLPKEHTCYTCCGDEITGDVEDVGLCPSCLEHI